MSTQRLRRGFSLLELLAVIVVVLAVTGVATAGYLDISRANNRAAELTQDARRATAILDRVARDLEAAHLAIKPPERDPLEHPWLFLAEARGISDGANRLKFVTRGQRPAASGAKASDLAQVAWFTRETIEGDQELLRWSFPRLSDGLDTRLPRDDDPGVFVAAEGVAAFGVRLMDEGGDWDDRWDSSSLSRSSQLPLVAEVSVSMATDEGGESETFVRRVVLPVRPFDLEAQLTGKSAAGGENGEGEEGEDGEAGADGQEDPDDCLRVRDCVNAGVLDGELLEIIMELQDQCLSDVGVPVEAVLAHCQGPQ